LGQERHGAGPRRLPVRPPFGYGGGTAAPLPAPPAKRMSPMATHLYREHPTMFADEPGKFLLACLLVPLGVGIVWLIWWYINNRSTVVTVDENRVSWRSGLFNKDLVEISIKSVRTVRVDQTFVDRIFNCGTLRVYSAGDKPDIEQAGLPHPDRLRAALRTARGGE
jgi:membrane protein YdbS with pleckstrin-like domain